MERCEQSWNSWIDKRNIPNRVRITPETGNSFYAKIQRADNPVVDGTPLNAFTFNYMVAMIQSLALDATVEEGE